MRRFPTCRRCGRQCAMGARRCWRHPIGRPLGSKSKSNRIDRLLLGFDARRKARRWAA